MTDAADHDKRMGAFPVSDLTRRLLRRATEPVGVIDVRHAAELHSRSSSLSGQRLELLEGLRRRYGLDPDGGAAGHTVPAATGRPFVEPLHRMAVSPFDWASAPSPRGRDRAAEAAAGAISEAPSASSAQHYRVKRPGRYGEPNPSGPGPLSSQTVTPQSHAVAGVPARTLSVAPARLLRKNDGTQSPDGSRRDASAPQVERAADARPADEPAPQHDDPSAAGTLPQVSELPHSTVAAQMPLQRMPDGGPTPTLSSPSSTERPPAAGGIDVNAPAAAATQLQPTTGDTRSPTGSRPEVFALPLLRAASTADTSRRVDEERAAGQDDPPAAGAVPLVSEVPSSAVTAPMLLQRMPDGSVVSESSRSAMRGALSGHDTSTSSRPSSAGPSPAASGIRLSTHSGAAAQPERTTGETPSPAGSAPDASALPPVRVAMADTPRGVGDEHALGHDDARAAGTLPQVSELPHSTVAAQMPLQRTLNGSVVSEIGRSSLHDGLSGDDASILSSPPSTELPGAASGLRVSTHSVVASELQRKTGDTPSPAGSSPDASDLPLVRTADIARRVGDEPARSLVSGALPRVGERPRSAVAAPQRRMPDGSATGATEHSVMRDDLPGNAMADTTGAPPHTNAQAQFRGAVSAEIRAVPPPPGSTGIVWRKADVNGASRDRAATSRAPTIASTIANGAQIMRADASESVSGPSAAPDATPAPESNGVDVFLVAEQVSRIISRQLRVERERRGRRR